MTNLIYKVPEIDIQTKINASLLHYLSSILGSTISYPDPAAIYDNTRRGRLDLSIYYLNIYINLVLVNSGINPIHYSIPTT